MASGNCWGGNLGLIDYWRLSTAHGWRRAGWSVRIWAKLFWMVVFAVGVLALALLLIMLWKEYGKGSVKMSSTYESRDVIDFPAVTVCNQNAVTAQGAPHKLTDLILYCSIGGGICNPQSAFVSIADPVYGTCYTFNGKGAVNSTILLANSGPDYGLTLILNAESDKYPSTAERSGFRLVVHPVGSKPLPTIDGFSLPSHYAAGVVVSPAVVTAMLASNTVWKGNNGNGSINVGELATVTVYFQDFIVKLTEESYSFNVWQLLSRMGGVSALCVGFSFLTLVEFVEMITAMGSRGGNLGRKDKSLDSDDKDGFDDDYVPRVSTSAANNFTPVMDFYQD